LKIATGRTPGAAFSIGTISLSNTRAKGAGRRRLLPSFFGDGSRGFFSIR
jgi:hypothetical protein